MEELIVFGVLVLFAIPILGIVNFVRISGVKDENRALRRLLQQLQTRLDALESGARPAGSEPTAPRAEETSESPAGEAIGPEPVASQPEEIAPAEADAPPPSQDIPEAPPPTSVPAATATGPRKANDLETQLGTRWAVWVGGLALALGGIFLVRYSIEQGWFGPAARIAAGLIFSAALIAAGEWLRRKEQKTDLGGIPAAHIPSIVTAAGTLSAFGTVYAAYALYHFLDSFWALIALGFVGIAAMVASVLHGPTLAGVGLVGSFATPLLVGGSGSVTGLVLFLAVINATADAVARVLRERWLAVGATVGMLAWGLLLVTSSIHGHGLAVALHIAALTAIGGLFLVYDVHRHGSGDEERDLLGLLPLIGGAALTVLFAAIARDATLAALLVGAVAVGIALMGLRFPAVGDAFPASAILSALAAWIWLADAAPLRGPEALIAVPPSAPTTYLVLFAGLGAFLTLMPVVMFARSPLPFLRRTVLAATGAVAAPALLALVVLRFNGFHQRDLVWAAAALAVALGLAILSEQFFVLEKKREEEDRTASGLYAAAALAALAIGFTLALEQGWLTIALALSAMGAAFVTLSRPSQLLRLAAAALGLTTALHVLYEPRIAGEAIGTTPIFNWLLLGYGVPAAAFALGARWLRSKGRDLASDGLEALAALFLAAFVLFEIRHAFHGPDFLGEEATLTETGLTVSALFILAIGFRWRAQAVGSAVFGHASRIASGFATLAAIAGPATTAHPLVTGEAMTGWPVFGSLGAGYLLPAVAAGAATLLGPQRPKILPYAGGIAALLLGLMFLLLEVRKAFVGPVLDEAMISDAENYAYSAVILAYGIGLLAAGFWTRAKVVRLGSLAIVVLAIAKVFLFDMAGLTGLWRALSFIGLGLVLVGIGLLYQRFFAGGDEAPPAEAEPQPSSGSA